MEREWTEKLKDLERNKPEVLNETGMEQTLEQQVPQKSNQEILQDHASEALTYNKLTSSISMEHIVTSLRRLNINNVYISEAYMSENLTVKPEYKGSKHSFRHFKFRHARERKNGTYICPLLYTRIRHLRTIQNLLDLKMQCLPSHRFVFPEE